jgi:hypothetical protein
MEKEDIKPDLGDEPSPEAHGEVEAHPSEARRLERDLGLGVKKTESPAPGMPSAQGGGLTTEIGNTPPETDPDH